MSTYTINTSADGLRYEAKQTSQGASVFIKNAVYAGILTDSALTEVTDIDYPSKHTYTLASLTSSGVTATATTTGNNSLEDGMIVSITGANPSVYNGDWTINATGSAIFTYTLGTATAPASGTILAVGGFSTVPGVVYLHDYMVVQRTDGPIQNSANGDASSWNALSFITPEKEPSNPVVIAKVLDAVASFKEWDTQFFIDGAIPAPASFLVSADAYYLKLGCASADSLVEFDGGIVWMSKRDNLQRSREIHVLNGYTPKKISDASVERILNNDDLSEVHALYLSTAGHQFYVLTLVSSEITIVYDFNTGFWYEWNKLTPGTTQTLYALSQEDGVATAIQPAHGLNDGDPVTIAGANQSGYNGLQDNISVVDANTFTFPVDEDTVSPATGTATATGYMSSYYPIVAYATYQNLDLGLGKSDGVIYSFDVDSYQDDGDPIDVKCRLPNWNGGTPHNKVVNRGQVVGDQVDANVMVRYSDDDYQTYSTYRPQNLNVPTSKLTRLGMTQKRGYEFRHTGNTEFRADSWDQEQTVEIL